MRRSFALPTFTLAVVLVMLLAAPTTVEASWDLSPILDCVVNHGNGWWTAYFGWENREGRLIRIIWGLLNRISGISGRSGDNCGQNQDFTVPNMIPGRPGRTPFYPGSPFKVDFKENDVVIWLLGLRMCTASKHSSRCPELDTVPPTITCPFASSTPANTVTVTVAGQATGSYVGGLTATASDNMPGVHVRNSFTANGTSASAFYPIGTTVVTFTAEDSAANKKTCTVTVNVLDKTPPKIVCPANIAVTTKPGSNFAVIPSFKASATDNSGKVPTVTNDAYPAGGAEAAGNYALGVKTVTFTAKDNSNNVASCTAQVTVTDAEAPVVTCALSATMPVTTASGSASSAPLTFSATATDNVGVVANGISYSINGGSWVVKASDTAAFPVGTTTVVFKALDAAGNSGQCTSTIVVQDKQAPVFTNCPAADFNINTLPGKAYGTISLVLGASDNADGAPTVTGGDFTAVQFPIGSTANSATAQDHATPPNTATCSFNVVVSDKEPPAMTCPTTLSVNTDAGLATATVPVTVSATDNSGQAVAIVNDLNSAGASITQTQFALGTTTIKFTGTDQSGNSASCTVDVVVADVEKPVADCSAAAAVANQSPFFTDAGKNFATVSGLTAGASDNVAVASLKVKVDTGVAVVGSDASGSFSVGSHTVVFTALDTSGNSGSCSISFVVKDKEAPAISASPTSVSQTVNPGQSAAVQINLLVSDNMGAAQVVVTNSHDSSTGTTFVASFSASETITFTATDAAGNTATVQVSVTITVGDYCSSNPCQNGGICSSTLVAPFYSCACAGSEYSGANCENVVPSPIAVITGAPASTPPCTGFTMSGAASQGAGLSYTWSLDSPVDIAVSTKLAAAGSTVTFASLELASNTYVFRLTVRDTYNRQATVTATTVVVPGATASISIQPGANIQFPPVTYFIRSRDTFSMSAQLVTDAACASQVAQWSFLWSATDVTDPANPKPAAISNSGSLTDFNINVGKRAVPNKGFFTFTVTATCINGEVVSATTPAIEFRYAPLPQPRGAVTYTNQFNQNQDDTRVCQQTFAYPQCWIDAFSYRENSDPEDVLFPDPIDMTVNTPSRPLDPEFPNDPLTDVNIVWNCYWFDGVLMDADGNNCDLRDYRADAHPDRTVLVGPMVNLKQTADVHISNWNLRAYDQAGYAYGTDMWQYSVEVRRKSDSSDYVRGPIVVLQTVPTQGLPATFSQVPIFAIWCGLHPTAPDITGDSTYSFVNRVICQSTKDLVDYFYDQIPWSTATRMQDAAPGITTRWYELNGKIDLSSVADFSLDFEPSSLPVGDYTVCLEVTVTATSASTKKCFSFTITDRRPVSSSATPMTVSPATGTAGVTRFSLAAQGWYADGSISYQFFYFPVDQPALLTPLGVRTSVPSFAAYLPAGTWGVLAYVYNSDGAYSVASTTATVTVSAAALSACDVLTIADGPLNTALLMKDSATVAQLVPTIAAFFTAYDGSAVQCNGVDRSANLKSLQTTVFNWATVYASTSSNAQIGSAVLSSVGTQRTAPLSGSQLSTVLAASDVLIASLPEQSDDVASSVVAGHMFQLLANLAADADCSQLGSLKTRLFALASAAINKTMPGSKGTTFVAPNLELFAVRASIVRSRVLTTGGAKPLTISVPGPAFSVAKKEAMADVVVLRFLDARMRSCQATAVAKTQSLLQAVNPDTSVSSVVVSELVDMELLSSWTGAVFTAANLQSAVTVTLATDADACAPANARDACALWDASASAWSTAGCTAAPVAGGVQCSCNRVGEVAVVRPTSECPAGAAASSTSAGYSFVAAANGALALAALGMGAFAMSRKNQDGMLTNVLVFGALALRVVVAVYFAAGSIDKAVADVLTVLPFIVTFSLNARLFERVRVEAGAENPLKFSQAFKAVFLVAFASVVGLVAVARMSQQADIADIISRALAVVFGLVAAAELVYGLSIKSDKHKEFASLYRAFVISTICVLAASVAWAAWSTAAAAAAAFLPFEAVWAVAQFVVSRSGSSADKKAASTADATESAAPASVETA